MAIIPKHRNQAHLVALGALGEVIEDHWLSIDEYYDCSSEMVDSAEFRRARKVRAVRGSLFGPKGTVIQEFENTYDAKGNLIHTKVVHEGGLIVERDIP